MARKRETSFRNDASRPVVATDRFEDIDESCTYGADTGEMAVTYEDVLAFVQELVSS